MQFSMKNNPIFFNANLKRNKWIIILSLLIFQVVVSFALAQENRISIQVRNQTVRNVMDDIESKTKMVFFYNDTDVDLNRRVSINLQNQTIQKVLDELFRNTHNAYKISDRQIFISRKQVRIDEPKQSKEVRVSVNGIVLDETNDPVIGANVMIEGTTTGTISDVNGQFSIDVEENNKLIVSYVGYQTKHVLIGKNTSVRIVLEPTTTTLEELIVVGYGTQTKETLVGSIAQVTSEKIKERGVVSSITDALSGSMPGVTVMTSTGIPGGQGNTSWETASSILIRGTSTWNNSSPLILVDGIERDMNDIDINEIESFSVLKDASATAVFGVKGANGVILVTTKRGKVGKPRVTFESNMSVKTVSLLNGPVGSYDALLARNYAIVNDLAVGGADHWTKYTPERVLNYYRDGVDPEKYTDVDWFDFMTRDYAISSKHNMTISGGTDFVKYFTSVGYLQDGDILNTSTPNAKGVTPEFRYDRFNFRNNFDFNITKTTQLAVNLSGYIGKQQASSGNYPTIMSGLVNANPNSPLPIYSDGVYGATDPITDKQNAYYTLMTSGTNVFNRNSFKSDFELKQKLDFVTKGLNFKGRFSFDNYYSSRGREVNDDGAYVSKYWDNITNQWIYVYPEVSVGFEFVPTPLVYTNEFINSSTAQQTLRNFYYEAGFNYNRTFNSHRIGALALFSRENFVTGSDWPNKREDWVGRVTYDYEGKYLFEFNGAYNGSAKFGPEYRFDFFPSLAAGWRISEELFFKRMFPQISNLKIKYSIGLIGNDNFRDMSMWPFITTYVNNPDRLARFGNSVFTNTPYNVAFREGTPGNPSLRWETARKQDAGLELELFNGVVSGSVNYFNEYRYDMLIAGGQRSIPDYYGATPSAVNSGEVKTNGLELEVTFRKKIGIMNLWASGNWTKAVNEILFKEDPALMPTYQKNEGFAIGQTRLQGVDGIITSWDDLYTGVLYETYYNNSTSLIPGDFRMIDYNADGIINNQDIVPIGYANYPQNTYAFSVGGDVKGFSFSLQFYGVYNVSIRAAERLEFVNVIPVVYPEILSRTWTPEYGNENPTWRTFNAVRDVSKGGATMGNSTLYDASFLRLKTAEIGYILPKKWTSSFSIERCRIYMNGNNLFLLSKMPFDVEGINYDYRSYPTTRLFNVGLQLTF
jgi:TonB-linked SusC/RagA family outer membrane protein